jgi:hypothetical protein
MQTYLHRHMGRKTQVERRPRTASNFGVRRKQDSFPESDTCSKWEQTLGTDAMREVQHRFTRLHSMATRTF